MNKNKTIIYVTIIVVILLIGIPSTIKVINNHNEKLKRVVINEIVRYAKDCYYNESCIDDKITLEELYDKTDLEEQINPVTKMKYNVDSYVLVSEDFKFVDRT
jgi:hypothetical protein